MFSHRNQCKTQTNHIDAKHKILKDYLQFSKDKLKTALSVVEGLEKIIDCLRSKEDKQKTALSVFEDLKKMMDC